MASLPRAAAVISDETDADSGDAILRVGAYKQAVTGEPIRVEAKFKNSYSLLWHGVMIQGMNNMVRIASAGGALWRRILILRFERNFRAEGIENPAVKDDFIFRRGVLQNILYRILHMDLLYRISPDIVATCEVTKQSARVESSQVFAALRDFEPLISEWAKLAKVETGETLRIPVKLLYDSYRDKWAPSNGYRLPVAYPTFRTQLASWAVSSADWRYHDKTMRISKPALAREFKVNPLLSVYPAHSWINHKGVFSPTGPGSVYARGYMYEEDLADSYRGVLEYTGN